MSFFGSLFSSPDIVKKSVDAVIDTGDALFFTDEEKSKANQKKLDWLLKFHEASSGSQIARRYLAVMFGMTFLSLVLLTAGFTAFGMFSIADQLLKLLTDTLVWPVGTIIVFYFGSGYIRDMTNKSR